MSTRGWVGSGILAVLLWAQVAAAQRVVVLEFQGDRKDKLRSQVEAALKKARVVDLVSIEKYKKAAAKKKVRSNQLMTPSGLAKVARSLGLDAAVEGALGDTFFVRILDPSGQELWSKDLPLKGGQISSDHARKLAKAIAAAAKSEPKKEEPVAEKETSRSEEAAPEEKPREEPASSREERKKLPDAEEHREPLSREEKLRRRRENDEEAHTNTSAGPSESERDADLETEARKRPRSKVGPRLITIALTGTTTWRAYCSRPGVKSCKEYDALAPDARPRGDTVEFSPQVPYAGFGIGVELFPLAGMDSPVKGLGVTASYARGFSLTNVRVQTPSGETPDKQVISVDQGVTAQAAYRYFFGLGESRDPLVGYVGFRAGLQVRSFDVDPKAQVPLPGSHRSYPALGVEVAFPLAKLARIEGGFSLFLGPKAGAEEIAGYGDPADPSGGVTSSGFGFELGLAGEVWGPLGYTVRYRMASYGDQFKGQGQKWPCDTTQCGGAAQEVYSSVHWGVTLGF